MFLNGLCGINIINNDALPVCEYCWHKPRTQRQTFPHNICPCVLSSLCYYLLFVLAAEFDLEVPRSLVQQVPSALWMLRWFTCRCSSFINGSISRHLVCSVYFCFVVSLSGAGYILMPHSSPCSLVGHAFVMWDLFLLLLLLLLACIMHTLLLLLL